MQLDKAIKDRHSVRKFTSKKPNWRRIIECIDIAKNVPMAGNNFTLKFILVQDKDIIEKLADAAQQDFISKTHYVVVVCSNPSRTINSYGDRGKIYFRQQAGAAIQNFLLKTQDFGLSTCWVGAFVDNLVKEALNVPKEVYVEAMFPIGYEIGDGKKRKSKIDLDSILYFDKYKNDRMKSPRKLNI